MEEKINLSLFEDFFLFSSPADYAKILINTSNPDENKNKCSRDKRQNIRFKRRIKGMSEAEKKNENADETLKRLQKKFLITIKMLKKYFSLHQKLIKENQNQRLKKVLQKGTILRKGMVAEIKKEKTQTMNCLKNTMLIIKAPSDTYKKLCEKEGERNETKVYLIEEVINKMKKNL